MGERAALKAGGPEQIRSEIEKTRAEMSQTIDEIRERVSAEHLKARLKDATVRRAGDAAGAAVERLKGWKARVSETVRKNPARLAVIALGIGAGVTANLLIRRKKGNSEDFFQPPEV